MKDEGFLSKLKKLLKDRHFYLVLLVLVVLTAVVVRLYILQIVEGETHEDEATVNSLVAVKIGRAHVLVLYADIPRSRSSSAC